MGTFFSVFYDMRDWFKEVRNTIFQKKKEEEQRKEYRTKKPVLPRSYSHRDNRSIQKQRKMFTNRRM